MTNTLLKDLSEQVRTRSYEPEPGKIYELIIIGGGPAGMTAAVYAARKHLAILLISLDFGGQVLWTSQIENYMGYQYINGRELAEKFAEQVKSFPIAIRVPDEVIGIEKQDQTFIVYTKYEGKYHARSLIIASGKRPRTLDIPGEKELTGRGVSYCAVCDAPLYRGKDVAVIGGANSAVLAAIDLNKIAKTVYLVVRSKIKADPILIDRLKNAERVQPLIGYLPIAISGKDKVESLKIKNTNTDTEQELSVNGVFIEAGLIPNVGFLREMVKLNERNEIIVNCNCETSEKGIFACGDVSSVSDKQIIIACGEGAKAALAAHRFLMTQK